MTTERAGEELEQLEPEEQQVSASPPMPEIARAAARDALGLEDQPAGESSSSSPAERRPAGKRKKKGRTKRDLLRENRELAARLAELRPAAPAEPGPEPGSGSSSEASAELPPVVTTRPQIDVTSAQMFAYSFLAFVFAALANERGDHWKLKEEDRAWTNYLGEGLAPFLPNLGAALPWLLGGMGLVTAVQARASIDKQLKAGGPAHAPSASGLTLA